MSSPDKAAGPQVTQDVLFQIASGHVITSATIFHVNTDGTVNLVFFGPVTPATVFNNAQFSAALDGTAANDNKWSYPQFQ